MATQLTHARTMTSYPTISADQNNGAVLGGNSVSQEQINCLINWREQSGSLDQLGVNVFEKNPFNFQGLCHCGNFI